MLGYNHGPTCSCPFFQITVNSYIANLAAVFAATSVVYHGPQTEADLLNANVCVPAFTQSNLDKYLQHPLVWSDGQQWGKRLIETNNVRVGTLVASDLGPNQSWPDDATIDDMMQGCSKMLEAAPIAQPMAIVVPASTARNFLNNPGYCQHFAIATNLQFSNMERAPHFIMTYESVRQSSNLLQTWNSVSKFISATEAYHALELKYLLPNFNCPAPAPDGSAVTLKDQYGAAWRSDPVCVVADRCCFSSV
jgi:hypothetical protein